MHRHVVPALVCTVSLLGAATAHADEDRYNAVAYDVALTGNGNFVVDEAFHTDNDRGKPYDYTRHLDGSYGFQSRFAEVWLPAEPGAGTVLCTNNPQCVFYKLASDDQVSGNATGHGGQSGYYVTRDAAVPWQCSAPFGFAVASATKADLVVARTPSGYTLATAPAPALETATPQCSEGSVNNGEMRFALGDYDNALAPDANLTSAVALPAGQVGKSSFTLTASESAAHEGTETDGGNCRYDPENAKPGDSYACHWSQGWTGTLTFTKRCDGHVTIGGGGQNSSATPHGACGGFKPGAGKACVVPRVVGLSLAAAAKRLTAHGCRRGHVTRRRTGPGRRGRVVSQSRKPGTRLSARASIALVVRA
jgi:hypothetical protein